MHVFVVFVFLLTKVLYIMDVWKLISATKLKKKNEKM